MNWQSWIQTTESIVSLIVGVAVIIGFLLSQIARIRRMIWIADNRIKQRYLLWSFKRTPWPQNAMIGLSIGALERRYKEYLKGREYGYDKAGVWRVKDSRKPE